MGHRMEFAWIAVIVDDDEDEASFAWPVNRGGFGGMQMVMGTDEESLISTRPVLKTMARRLGRKVTIVRFDQRTDLETVEP